ncbi:MAG: Spy/CpxP family protein refolding chaperone [Bacillariaceae sp.]|jgi:Spy/CpxP family protein refolding chaperone
MGAFSSSIHYKIFLFSILFADTSIVVDAFYSRTALRSIHTKPLQRTQSSNGRLPLWVQPEYSENKTFIVEDRIREVYREWCQYYGRPYDEKYLKTFASNFIAVEQYHRQTKQSLVLNEFADMTERDYEQYLAMDSNVDIMQQPPNIQPPIPNSQTPLVHNSNDISYRDSSEASNMNDVLAALQSTVSSLSTMAQSLSTGTSPSMSPSTERDQPLDSLVIDVLEKQDVSIAQLEDSVEGLREIQVQSSDLIQLVSQNQIQMTEMMEAVQSEVDSLRSDQERTENKNSELTERIDELETTIAEYKSIALALPPSRRTPISDITAITMAKIKPLEATIAEYKSIVSPSRRKPTSETNARTMVDIKTNPRVTAMGENTIIKKRKSIMNWD